MLVQTGRINRIILCPSSRPSGGTYPMAHVVDRPRVSLNAHLTDAGVADDLRHLICDIARAGKYVHNAIRTTDLGLADSSNQFGEQQLKLDVLSNNIIRDELMENRLIHSIASQEESSIRQLEPDDAF